MKKEILSIASELATQLANGNPIVAEYTSLEGEYSEKTEPHIELGAEATQQQSQ